MEEGQPVFNLNEWIVLSLVAEQPCHGFAVATLVDRGGEMGRIWSIARPTVYYTVNRLADRGIIAATGNQDGLRGNPRTIYAAGEEARAYVDEWLETPTPRVRDMRSELLLKLTLLRRRGRPLASLVRRQREVLLPIAAELRERERGEDEFGRLLLSWRRGHAALALDFLDTIEASPWFGATPR